MRCGDPLGIRHILREFYTIVNGILMDIINLSDGGLLYTAD